MNKFIIFVFFTFFFNVNTFAQEISIVVDINYLLENSKKGKSLKKDITSKRDQNNKKFNQIENELKDKEKKLISKKNILSEAEFNNQLKKFQDEVKEYNEKKKKKNNELMVYRNASLGKLLSEINSIVVDYSKKNNVQLAIDKKYVILIKKERDVTASILEILNK